MGNISFNKISFNFSSSLKIYYVVDVISSDGVKAGDLILCRKSNVNLTIHYANNNYIDFYFDFHSIHNSCIHIVVYGLPSLPKKHLTCYFLSSLNNLYTMDDWIVWGDFSLVKSSIEKKGKYHIY